VPDRPRLCGIHACGQMAEVALRYPPGARHPALKRDEDLWFCRGCAPAYRRMGYVDAGREPEGQAALDV
jgi:hypothetical protein